jgi:hypothetical protein
VYSAVKSWPSLAAFESAAALPHNGAVSQRSDGSAVGVCDGVCVGIAEGVLLGIKLGVIVGGFVRPPSLKPSRNFDGTGVGGRVGNADGPGDGKNVGMDVLRILGNCLSLVGE